MLVGLMPTSPVQAESLARPLQASGDFLWAGSMGAEYRWTESNGVVGDSSGNVYITGRFQGTVDFDPGAGIANLTSAEGDDAFVVKLDSGGNYVWAKSMGGMDWDIGKSIALDSSGNIYITGVLGNAFVVKLDNDGNLVWAGGALGGNSIVLDASGNIYVMGNFEGTVDFDPGPGTANLTSAGFTDIFIYKLDNDGNFIWAKRMGGGFFDSGYNMTADSNGNIYTTGFFSSIADFDPGAGTANLSSSGGTDIFVSKLDSDGNFVWAKKMGGPGDDNGSGIALDSIGKVYITGKFYEWGDFDPGDGWYGLTSAGSSDGFISKLDNDGNFIWAKGIGGTGYDSGNDIRLDLNSNILSTGSFSGTVDFDPGVGEVNLTGSGAYVLKLGA